MDETEHGEITDTCNELTDKMAANGERTRAVFLCSNFHRMTTLNISRPHGELCRTPLCRYIARVGKCPPVTALERPARNPIQKSPEKRRTGDNFVHVAREARWP